MMYAYLVYKHRGVTRVKKGWFDGRNNFVPVEKGTGTPWHVNNPTRPMTLYNGKVFCYDEEQIPEAIKMVEDNYDRNGEKLKEQCERRIAKKEKEKNGMNKISIEEAIDLLRNGSRNYKKGDYYTAYNMGIAALEALKRLDLEFYEEGDSIDDVVAHIKDMSEEEVELLKQLINSKITGTEYDKGLAEIKARHNYEYDIHLTEAELKAIKHALTDLKWRDEKFSDRVWCREYGRQVSFDDSARARVELAVIKDLLNAIEEAEK